MAKLIGQSPNQVPTNADLGTMAYKDGENLQAGPLTIKDGKVGVGTTSPDSLIEVSDASSATIKATKDAGTVVETILFASSASVGGVGTATNQDFTFRTNNAERMRLDNNGNLGIGGVSPVTGLKYLDIYNTGSTSTDGALMRLITQQVGSTSTTSADITKRKNGEFRISNFDTDPAAYTAFNVGASERMKITSTGEVQVASGLLELDGNDIGGTEVTIADDAVASITPPRNGGFMFVTSNGNTDYPSRGFSNYFFYDVGLSLDVEELFSRGSIDVSTSDVTGTTGTDNNITVAVQSGVVKIENRSGASRTFQITFM